MLEDCDRFCVKICGLHKVIYTEKELGVVSNSVLCGSLLLLVSSSVSASLLSFIAFYISLLYRLLKRFKLTSRQVAHPSLNSFILIS